MSIDQSCDAGRERQEDQGVTASPPGSQASPGADKSSPPSVSIPNAIHIWFADNGNIRKWATEPFAKSVPYYVEGDRVCVDPDPREHGLCGCVVGHAREIMQHWTGTNCTWVDDDITALGILAGKAIRAGLYFGDDLPQSLVNAITRHVASGIEAATADETRSGSAEGESPAAESRDAQSSQPLTPSGSPS